MEIMEEPLTEEQQEERVKRPLRWSDLTEEERHNLRVKEGKIVVMISHPFTRANSRYPDSMFLQTNDIEED